MTGFHPVRIGSNPISRSIAIHAPIGYWLGYQVFTLKETDRNRLGVPSQHGVNGIACALCTAEVRVRFLVLAPSENQCPSSVTATFMGVRIFRGALRT